MSTTHQFGITVSPLVYQRVSEKAKVAGMAPNAYATALFEAAYAARCGKSMGDEDLDAWVGACMALYGGGISVDAIAKVLGVSPKVVNRIIVAWRRVLGDREAA